MVQNGQGMGEIHEGRAGTLSATLATTAAVGARSGGRLIDGNAQRRREDGEDDLHHRLMDVSARPATSDDDLGLKGLRPNGNIHN